MSSSVGRDIENAIQSMLAISEQYASLKARLDKATSDLSILETLFSVSKYIGSDPETHVVLSVLEDSVKGVFGASECHVIFSPQRAHLSDSAALYAYLNYDDLKVNVEETLYIEDVTKSDLTSLDHGALLIIRLSVGDELYGFLAIYWTFTYELSDSSMMFLRIISNQVSMYLKSAKLVDEFKQLAVLDPLTGIYNRSYFSNIESTTLPVKDESILMFDIDKFKRINDTYGHQYGDKILKQFANILQERAEQVGAVAFKYGGEEFVIKSIGGSDQALKLAEQVRADFEDQTGFTVSVGISTCGHSCNVTNYKHLLELADESLYISKQSGRNRTTVSNADVQLIKKSAHAIARLISKAYREGEIQSVFRLSLNTPIIVSEEQYVKIKQVISNVTRMYDDVYFTASLDVLIIIKDKIVEKKFISRINNLIKAQLPEMDYTITQLSDQLKEIVKHSDEMATLAIDFAKANEFSDEDIKQLRLMAQWHDIGQVFIEPQQPERGNHPQNGQRHAWLSYLIAYQQPHLSEVAHWLLYHHDTGQCCADLALSTEDVPQTIQTICALESICQQSDHKPMQQRNVLNKVFKTFAKEKKYETALLHKLEKYLADKWQLSEEA